MGYVSCDHRAELCFMCMTLSFSLENMMSVFVIRELWC